MPLDVKIDQPKLHAALKAANGIAERVAKHQPILSCVHLRADKTSFCVSATDLMLSSVEAISAEISKAGVLCVTARHLLNVVATLPSKEIRLQELENHWVQLTCGRISMKLAGVAPTDFPNLPQVEKLKMATVAAAPPLADLIDKTAFSISGDEARVNLNGLLLESTGKRVTAVSTDGHRLTKAALDLVLPKLENGIIIPRRGVTELRSLLARAKTGEIELGVSENRQHLFVRSGGLTLALKLAQVVFPPYMQVIPNAHRREAKVDRVELTLILTRSLTLAPETTASVRMSFSAKGKLLAVHADNPDLGVIDDEVELDGFTGEDIIVGYNAHYLIDALRAITTKLVVMRLQGELDPLTIAPVDGPEFISVVMPMRI